MTSVPICPPCRPSLCAGLEYQPLFQGQVIPLRLKTWWGSASITDAERGLLAEALQDTQNKRWVGGVGCCVGRGLICYASVGRATAWAGDAPSGAPMASALVCPSLFQHPFQSLPCCRFVLISESDIPAPHLLIHFPGPHVLILQVCTDQRVRHPSVRPAHLLPAAHARGAVAGAGLLEGRHEHRPLEGWHGGEAGGPGLPWRGRGRLWAWVWARERESTRQVHGQWLL